MVNIRGKFSKDNYCAWSNFVKYYSDGFNILSAITDEKGNLFYDILAPTKKAFEKALKESNR